ncbi:MAG: cellulase family glycosylhydrolase, partial [Planctomycetota bacterium]
FWPELDEYAKAVVSRYVGDERIVIWDVMNEPSATPLAATQNGRKQLLAFLTHYCKLVKQLDPNHPTTVGVARADNSFVLDLVDVLSCHSYLPGVESTSTRSSTNELSARATPTVVGWFGSSCLTSLQRSCGSSAWDRSSGS